MYVTTMHIDGPGSASIHTRLDEFDLLLGSYAGGLSRIVLAQRAKMLLHREYEGSGLGYEDDRKWDVFDRKESTQNSNVNLTEYFE